MARLFYLLVAAALGGFFGAGCATVPLDSARSEFNNNRLELADQRLATLPGDRNTVLHLMERGMIRHLRHDYAGSTTDWLAATQREEALETHSAGKAGASMVVNDSLLDFRGYPYERMLLHAFLARNFIARELWDAAAVEARRITRMLENLDGFPDNPYCRYLAAVCFELSGDTDNSAMLYRETAKRLPSQCLDPGTGRFLPLNVTQPPPPTGAPFTGAELVCFLDFDGAYGLVPDHAEIHADGKLLGISRTLADTRQLEAASRQRMAVRHGAKAAARLAVKYAAAEAIKSRDNDLGQLLWMLLLAAEQEDQRRWETLPAKLAVVRAPCPENLREFQVVFKSFSGSDLRRITVRRPLARKGRVFVSFCRDNPWTD